MRHRGILFTALIVIGIIGFVTGTAFADSFYWYSSNSDWTNPDKWRQGSASGSTGTVPTNALMQTSGDTLNFGDLKTDGVCNLSVNAGIFDVARLYMHNGAVLNIQNGGSLATGWGRVGNNTAAAVHISGNGTFQIKDNDLYLGLDGGYGELKMYDTSSLTTISTDGEPDTLHLSAYANGSTSLFQLNGSNLTVDVDEFHILSNQWSGTSNMEATLEYVLDAQGASTIITGQTGIGEGNGTAHLVLSGEVTPPPQDIVLIETTGTDAIGGAGVFTTVNNASAAEGALVYLSNNIYSLTYQYDAAGDGADNDIALQFVGTGTMPYASDPSPMSGAMTDADDTLLSWSNAQGAIRNEIYLGTDQTAVANAQKLAGDVNGDRTVDITDLSEVALQWLSAPSSPCPDLDYSGVVDLPDLAKVANDWQDDAGVIYLGATTSDTFDPGTLEPGKTYYWRVDSVYCDHIESGVLWNFQTSVPPLLAFPGAEGFGALASGGRGGDVYHVTNVDIGYDGVGSFFDAISTVPPEGRTIVFDVSGYIRVPSGSDGTTISASNVTIAGQTAPGDGIGFYNNNINITGDNIVMRHLRFRRGNTDSSADCIDINANNNTMLDHISFAFSTDENFSSFGTPPTNLTFQYSLNSWGLESHSCGGLWDQNTATAHHTLWAHNHTRNPKARSGMLEWINNVTFDWDIGFIMGDSETPMDWKSNVIGNYFIGPPGNTHSKALVKGTIDRNGRPNFTVYLSDNLIDVDSDGILDGVDNGYGIVEGTAYAPGTSGLTPGSSGYYQSPNPMAGSAAGVTTDPPLLAYKKIVSNAGALRLDANYTGTLRDEVDTIMINNLVTQTPFHVSDPSQTGASNGGLGTLNSGTAPTDTDGDGMPDFWERSIGSNWTQQNHNDLIAAGTYIDNVLSGYTLLDEYLHFCAIPHAVIPMRTATEPSSLSVDLRKFTRGFNVAPVTFSLSDIQNGSATVQPDGYTVVFEPALDFSGRARFDFTVTDGDGSAWTQTLAVLVKLPPPPTYPNGLWAAGSDGSVSLDWDDNSQGDLAGYNVYRTTTSGSAYVQLNTSPVTTSDFTDTEVTNGTLYHYIVKAVDASMNESDATSEVSAAPAAMPSLIIQENTLGFCGVDDSGTIDNNNPGFTGDGFVNTENAVGEGIDWNVNIPAAGTYTVTWHYANGSSDRPGNLLVDSSTAASGISFPTIASGDWTVWGEVSRTVSLSAGNHTLRLAATTSGGLGNIDFIKITGSNITPNQCN